MASYLDYTKAIVEKERLVKEELNLRVQGEKCAECSYISGQSIREVADWSLDYCREASLEDTEYGVECNNYFSYWDDATFEIVEVDVIE